MDAQWTEYGATFQWFISDLMEPLCPFRKKKKKINISLQQMSQRKLLMSGSTGRREYTTFNLSLCFLILLVHHLPVEDFNSVEVKHIWLIPSRCSFPAHHSSFHSLKVKTEHSIPKFTLLLGCICAAMLLQASRFAFFLVVFSWTLWTLWMPNPAFCSAAPETMNIWATTVKRVSQYLPQPQGAFSLYPLFELLTIQTLILFFQVRYHRKHRW